MSNKSEVFVLFELHVQRGLSSIYTLCLESRFIRVGAGRSACMHPTGAKVRRISESEQSIINHKINILN
jgi:hypothetical protein